MELKFWIERNKEKNIYPTKMYLKTCTAPQNEDPDCIAFPLNSFCGLEEGEIKEATLMIQSSLDGKSKELKELKVKYDLIGWVMRSARNDKTVIETNYSYEDEYKKILEGAFPDFYDHFKIWENTEGYLMIQAKDAWFSCPAGSSEFNQNKP